MQCSYLEIYNEVGCPPAWQSSSAAPCKGHALIEQVGSQHTDQMSL